MGKLRILRRRSVQICLGLMLAGIGIRLLPLFFPIRAQDITQDQLAIEFSDRHGAPLGTLLSQDQNHTATVPLDQVSLHFIQAIIAAEDKRYYQHGALDLQAIGRAVLEAAQAGEIVSGASTITMQLARMLDRSPRTLSAKLLEIWTSWRLVAGMTPDEILQAYINRLPMGGNLYGVEAASRAYFGVPASDLTLAQASLLAALPNDPTDLNPYHHWSALKQRQQYVLDRMVEDGYITAAAHQRTIAETVQFQPREQNLIAPHFLFWVAQQLTDDSLPADANPARIPHLQTTLDQTLQQFVEAQVQQTVKYLTDKTVNHAAAIVVDHRTAEVLAYVGSPNYFDATNSGQNDGVQALRQPGSTLKPFLYQLALDKHIIQPHTILADVPTSYAIPGAKLYQPTDYSETFLGPVRVRAALANSLNVPAVRVLEQVGVSAFLEQLQNLGFIHLNQDPEHYGLGLTLGSGEVNLWELAQAYSTLANNGKSQPLVTTAALPVATPATTEVDPENWQLVTDMLSDRHARAAAFGVDSVLNLPFPAAVKTGTSSDYRDTWTVGFTTDYVVATWVGNFDGAPMQEVSGVMGAAPLWSRIMLELHRQHPPDRFSPPNEFVQLPICATTGQKPTAECSSGTVLEYFSPANIAHYQQVDSEFELTSDYNSWLAQQQLTGSSEAESEAQQLKILVPKADDYFLVSPGGSARIEFKVHTSSQQPIEWWLNQQKIATQASPALFWDMPVGQWNLTVKQGEFSQQVSFQVQTRASPSPAQGFSVVDSSEE